MKNVKIIKISISILILLLVMLSGSFSARAQSSTIDWSADLRYLIEKLDTIHPNPYARVGEDTFKYRATQLHQSMKDHTDKEITVHAVDATDGKLANAYIKT